MCFSFIIFATALVCEGVPECETSHLAHSKAAFVGRQPFQAHSGYQFET